jgi:flagellar basal-body rod modification protein FlgD
LNGAGRVVHEAAAPARGEGVHDFTWTGGQDGQVYTLKVVARDGAGAEVPAQVLIRGRVTGVEMYDGAPYLVIGDSILPLSTVISLNEITDRADNDDTEKPDVPTEEAAA